MVSKRFVNVSWVKPQILSNSWKCSGNFWLVNMCFEEMDLQLGRKERVLKLNTANNRKLEYKAFQFWQQGKVKSNRQPQQIYFTLIWLGNSSGGRVKWVSIQWFAFRASIFMANMMKNVTAFQRMKTIQLVRILMCSCNRDEHWADLLWCVHVITW